MTIEEAQKQVRACKHCGKIPVVKSVPLTDGSGYLYRGECCRICYAKPEHFVSDWNTFHGDWMTL